METFIKYGIPILAIFLLLLLLYFIPKTLKFIKKSNSNVKNLKASNLAHEAHLYLLKNPEFQKEVEDTVNKYASDNSKGTE